jgi:hypothetical protein
VEKDYLEDDSPTKDGAPKVEKDIPAGVPQFDLEKMDEVSGSTADFSAVSVPHADATGANERGAISSGSA